MLPGYKWVSFADLLYSGTIRLYSEIPDSSDCVLYSGVEVILNFVGDSFVELQQLVPELFRALFQSSILIEAIGSKEKFNRANKHNIITLSTYSNKIIR